MAFSNPLVKHIKSLPASTTWWIDLELDGVTMGRLMAAAKVPWNIKPLLGMLSDTFPLGGYHRTSYLVLACSLSILLHSWIGLSAVSSLGLVALHDMCEFHHGLLRRLGGCNLCHPGQRSSIGSLWSSSSPSYFWGRGWYYGRVPWKVVW